MEKNDQTVFEQFDRKSSCRRRLHLIMRKFVFLSSDQSGLTGSIGNYGHGRLSRHRNNLKVGSLREVFFATLETPLLISS